MHAHGLTAALAFLAFAATASAEVIVLPVSRNVQRVSPPPTYVQQQPRASVTPLSLGRTPSLPPLETMPLSSGSMPGLPQALQPSYDKPRGLFGYPGNGMRILVAFRKPDEVVVAARLEVSNVVLQFADGVLEKIEGPPGPNGAYAGTGMNAGKSITMVWVKAGPNLSGAGPGFGERFDQAAIQRMTQQLGLARPAPASSLRPTSRR